MVERDIIGYSFECSIWYAIYFTFISHQFRNIKQFVGQFMLYVHLMRYILLHSIHITKNSSYTR